MEARSLQFQSNDIAVVLPSLDPDSKFTGVVNGLIDSGFKRIVIVDDGSDEAHQQPFAEADKHDECHVIHHGVNKGKGRALKTAFSYILENFPDVNGAVTIDGDGQHLTEDIIRCCEVMLENGDKVVLGCRDFDAPGVPPRSVAGNKSTSRLFKILFGIKLSDTQTGLRAIPAQYLEAFTRIKGERFEYETNMLLQMHSMKIGFIEQPIATVYDSEDYSSHYNAFKDSFKVAKIMFAYMLTTSSFRYVVSSVLSWLVDNGLTYALYFVMGIYALPQILARIVSSFFNFNMNRSYVFGKKGDYFREMLRYYCLCIPQTAISVVALHLVVENLSISAPGLAVLFKIIIELILFIISYFIQKKWVFM